MMLLLTHHHHHHQIRLLNSISENFDAAMVSAQSKADYLQQIGSIVKGVEVS